MNDHIKDSLFFHAKHFFLAFRLVESRFKQVDLQVKILKSQLTIYSACLEG